MTISPPVVAPVSVGVLNPHFRQYSDIVPFTYRTGTTYMEETESIRRWILGTLVPFLNTEFSEMENSWEDNVDGFLDQVQTAITANETNVNAAIAQAITDFAAAHVNVTDTAVAAVLNVANSSTIAFLNGHYAPATLTARVATLESADVIQAPIVSFAGTYFVAGPSGNDDSATLKAAADAAQATKGRVQLQPGVYLCNLNLASGFNQALIVGAGKRATTLRAYTHTAPVVKFNGGSGAISGGGLRDLFIDGVDRTLQSVGVALSGCGGVKLDNVHIEGCDSAVQFWNERTGDFTEFCAIKDSSVYNCNHLVRYTVSNGVESFHGCGVEGNTVFGFPSSATGGAIKTEGIALPYNSPLSVTVFFSAVGQLIAEYGQTTSGRHASFYGNLRMENASVLGTNAVLCTGPNARIYYNGTVSGLGVGTVVLGALLLADRIGYEGSRVIAELKRVHVSGALKSTPTLFIPGLLDAGETAEVTVHIAGGNYDKSYSLRVYQSPYDGTGPAPVQIAKMSNIDNASIGEPTFTWSDNGLYISNSLFTTSQTAHVSILPLGGGLNDANLFRN